MRLSLPRTLFHRISFMSRIGIWSGREKSIVADASASGAVAVFVAVSDACGVTTSYGVGLGVVVNAFAIELAAASNWVIGGTPRIVSIVRRTETDE